MSDLRNQIKKDFITAFKAREKEKANALRNLESAIKAIEIDTRKELSDEEVVKILRSEMKKRQDSIEMYKKGNRPELAEAESYEVEVIQAYLPAQMSREEVEKIVDGVKTQAGEDANFGQVMGMVMGKVQGKADGKLVAEVVKSRM